jgi:hypothetical protein
MKIPRYIGSLSGSFGRRGPPDDQFGTRGPSGGLLAGHMLLKAWGKGVDQIAVRVFGGGVFRRDPDWGDWSPATLGDEQSRRGVAGMEVSPGSSSRGLLERGYGVRADPGGLYV